MRLFLDTANVDEIKRANDLGVLDGVTTNPTLVSREGRNFEEVLKEICDIVDGPISAEVISLESAGMVKEARKLSRIDKNVIIKIPMTLEGLKAVKILSSEGIKTNVTLVFSVNQALLAAKAGASFVSPFLGRLDDIGEDGLEVLADCVQVFAQHGFSTEIIAASIRSSLHVRRAALLGCDIATIPYKVLEQMSKHILTDKGIERFLADWEKVKDKQ